MSLGVSTIGCSLANSWFGISWVMAWAFQIEISEFPCNLGATGDLCNKAYAIRQLSIQVLPFKPLIENLMNLIDAHSLQRRE